MSLFAVTGGAGFIGSHLVDALLAEGHSVRVLDDLSTGRRANLPCRCELVVADVADPDAVRHALSGVAGCFHLAAVASVARSQEDWLGTNRTNLGGTLAVLDAARQAGGLPVVYASSAAVYGDVGDQAAHEGLPPRPSTAYGADKYGSELHAYAGWVAFGLPSFGLRFFNVYGPRQDPASPYSGVISIFAQRAAGRMPVTLHGDGGQTRDFVFVSDVVVHLRAAMARLLARGNQAGAEVANVCTGRSTSIRALACSLGRLHGHVPELTSAPARLGDIRKSLGDPARAWSLLGVRSDIPLDAGLAAMIEQQYQPHG